MLKIVEMDLKKHRIRTKRLLWLRTDTYHLMSVTSHFGLTTKTGNYVSDVYNVKGDSWFHYDDETVTPITESVVTASGRQKNGYIFFYIYRDLFEQLQKSDERGR